ncbi:MULTISPECIES: AMP-binding protein [unclassified Streptomyces]|uniref:class I adenylate-forming enzyme family protein n=1 Tax=unclassified Streptomyces TaxID=2593676 RepID=UPI0003A661C9|nr:AMP-binding protein [Streptomyces sp. HmicA12]
MAKPHRVQDLLDEAALAHPDSPAVRDRHGAWDYTALDRAAHRAASWLRAQGVGPGDRVAVRLGNVREFVALLFGTLRAGAVLVPVNPAMKDFHLSSVLADCEPRLALTAPGEEDVLARYTDCPVRPVTDLALDEEGPLAPEFAPEEPVAVGSDDLALLIYTSGSTSRPKAVMSPHGTTVFAARAIASRLGYRADDVVLTAIPLSFDYGLYQIFLAALAGAELVLTDADAHTGLMATLHEHGVTVVPLVPSLAEMLVRLAARDRRGPTALRLVTNTGAALTPPLIATLRTAFPAVKVVPMFGITECKRVTILEPDGDLERPFSVGRPLPGTEVLILDEHGTPLPPGTAGEIVVRGEHVMAGYWRAPELTAERFRTDPVTGRKVLHTGDYGHLDEDGHLYFHGRRDDMFKRRGVRMSALEIEAAALDIPGVRGAAVLPPDDGRELTLFAVGALEPKEITARLGERLEAAKVPPRCLTVDSLPLTANGKTDKKALAALLESPARAGELTVAA